MKINRTVLGATALVGLAFIAGRSGWLADSDAHAFAQDQTGEMSADMVAMMEAGSPGEMHAALEPLVGSWEGEVTIYMPGMGPMKMPTTVEREWVLSGLFVKEVVTSSTEMGNFEGLGYIGYDNLDGQYEGIWMDNMTSFVQDMEGYWNMAANELVMHSTIRDAATGKLSRVESTMTLAKNKQVMKSWTIAADGTRTLAMEGSFRRKVDASR